MTPEPLINTYAVLVPCGEGDLFVSGTLPLERTESIQDDAPMSRSSRDKLRFTLRFSAPLLYPGYGQLIPLLIRLLLGVESPVRRRG